MFYFFKKIPESIKAECEDGTNWGGQHSAACGAYDIICMCS